jgi:hypothetical protein
MYMGRLLQIADSGKPIHVTAKYTVGAKYTAFGAKYTVGAKYTLGAKYTEICCKNESDS